MIRFVMGRVDCSRRTFWTSGSEKGASPRKVSLDQSVLAPLPPHSPP